MEDSKRMSHESDTEDISDEAYLERHTRCEESEKKKFMSYIKLPLAVRSRANRRTDSRAESSGANTPGRFLIMTLKSPGSIFSVF